MPVDWAPFVRTVEADELDEFEDTEEDELVRESVFRGTPNIPLTSSGFIEFPSMEPHPGRDIWGKLGGFATAVMGLDTERCSSKKVRRGERFSMVVDEDSKGACRRGYPTPLYQQPDTPRLKQPSCGCFKSSPTAVDSCCWIQWIRGRRGTLMMDDRLA